jgi:hypothetical protein
LSIDDLKSVKDWSEIAAAFSKVMELAGEFFNIPKVVSDSEKAEATEQPEKGESQKN